MDKQVIMALISLLGTLVGSSSGIFISSKLMNYRIEQLEKKVDKINDLAEEIPVIREQVKVANHRIENLESVRK